LAAKQFSLTSKIFFVKKFTEEEITTYE